MKLTIKHTKQALLIIFFIVTAFSIEKANAQPHETAPEVVHSVPHRSEPIHEGSHFTNTSHEVIVASTHEFPHNYSPIVATADNIAVNIKHENTSTNAQLKTNTKAFDNRNAQTQISPRRQPSSHITTHETGKIYNVKGTTSRGYEPVKQTARVNEHTAILEQRATKLNKIDRSGRDFTKAGKEVVKEQNAVKNGGKMKCERCNIEVQQAKKHQKGVTPPSNEAQVDHKIRRRERGRGNPDNGALLCRGCNIEKH